MPFQMAVDGSAQLPDLRRRPQNSLVELRAGKARAQAGMCCSFTRGQHLK